MAQKTTPIYILPHWLNRGRFLEKKQLKMKVIESFMATENETYFGDKSTFAIRYVPGSSDITKKKFYAYCHMVLGGQIIGNKNEICYLNSWKYSLENLKNRIKNNFESICHSQFEGKNDKELFELIVKANQLEDDYKLEYKHLPVLDNEVWINCHISLDETTDAFSIMMTEQNGKIKFLWEGWREPCPADKINRLYSTIVDRLFTIEKMEKCLLTIENEYPHLARV